MEVREEGMEVQEETVFGFYKSQEHFWTQKHFPTFICPFFFKVETL